MFFTLSLEALFLYYCASTSPSSLQLHLSGNDLKLLCFVKWEIIIAVIISINKLDWAETSLVAQWIRIACQCRGHGFDPYSGKITHAVEQLSLWAKTTEPRAPSKRGHHSEKPAHHNKDKVQPKRINNINKSFFKINKNELYWAVRVCWILHLIESSQAPSWSGSC